LRSFKVGTDASKAIAMVQLHLNSKRISESATRLTEVARIQSGLAGGCELAWARMTDLSFPAAKDLLRSKQQHRESVLPASLTQGLSSAT
jgi:hypothetical protein